MDQRKPLSQNKKLILGDVSYTVCEVIGFGSNAFVYIAKYQDNLHRHKQHTVLIKELFPYHSQGLITRDPYDNVICAEEAAEYFDLHKKSFLRGNITHLDIQNIRADMASVNINSFEQNNTIYTILAYTNGETLQVSFQTGTITKSIRDITICMINILEALSVFHENNLLHLDVSPDNILLMPLDDKKSEKYRKMVLIDYNSSWNLNEIRSNDNIYFSMKEYYSAPEVRLNDRKSISAASDLFSVAAIFLEYLQREPLDFTKLYSNKKSMEKNIVKSLNGMSATVVHKAIMILRKGLKLPPNHRYQSVKEMIDDLEELLGRIDGVGITHSALWDTSRANFVEFVQSNDQYKYLMDTESLLPCKMSLNENKKLSVLVAIKEMYLMNKHGMILGSGGMGKTTSMFLLLREGTEQYNPNIPVPIYIPLYNYRTGSVPYIKGCLLEKLKFDKRTVTIQDALRALDALFEGKGSPGVLLLLDGLNETSGNIQALLLEIDELINKPGVKIILSSRTKNICWEFDQFEMLPLEVDKIKEHLNKNGVLYPANEKLKQIIANPMMLSMYTKACISKQKGMDIESGDELIEEYINSLLLTHKKQTIGNEAEQIMAKYAVNFILPAICRFMNRNKKHSLTSLEIYIIVQSCFRDLKQNSFLKAFPEFIGKIKYINGDAETAEEWFDSTIYVLLKNKFGLLLKDKNEKMCLIHQNFCDYLSKVGEQNQKIITRVKAVQTIPYAILLVVLVMGLIFGGIKIAEQLPNHYPETIQEKNEVENAVTMVVASMGYLDLKINASYNILDATEESYSGFIKVVDHQLLKSKSLVVNERDTEQMIGMLNSLRYHTSMDNLKEIVNAPNKYQIFFDNLSAELKEVYKENSLYRTMDKVKIVNLCRQYIDNYANIYYAKIQLLMMSLNSDGRKPLLNAIPYTEVFGMIFNNKVFDTDKVVIEESIISLENSQKGMVLKLNELGVMLNLK